jgi:hypothetical protein
MAKTQGYRMPPWRIVQAHQVARPECNQRHRQQQDQWPMWSTINGVGGIHRILVRSQIIRSQRSRPTLFYTLFFSDTLFAYRTTRKGCNRILLIPVIRSPIQDGMKLFRDFADWPHSTIGGS